MATPRSATPSVNNFDPPHTSTTVKSKTNKKSILNPSLIDFVDDNNLDRATSRSSHTHDKSFNFHKKPSDSPTDKYHPGLNRYDFIDEKYWTENHVFFFKYCFILYELK